MITRYINARVLDARGEYNGFVYTDGEEILYAGELEPKLIYHKEIDCKGLVLMPAFVDLHCHLRDPGYPKKETLATGMIAAIKGGYTALCAMANTLPVTETPEQVEANHARAKALKLCDLYQAAAAGIGLNDETPTDWEALAKVTPMITNDGKTIFSDEFMEKLMIASKEHGFVISTHCQPERQIVKRDIDLLRKVGGDLHVGHISHRETLDMIRAAKAEGLELTCEVTPHHLIGYDLDYKVNPPIRSKADTEALIEGAKDGSIDCLSTDHAPHTPEDKANGMAGISNIEYAFGAYWHVFHGNGIPLTRLSEMASKNTAARIGRKAGLIEPGYIADLILVDPDWTGRIRKDEMISRSNNTPFDGYPIRGRIVKTIVRGEIRYELDHGQA
ncbi:MAG: dihydroorotase [Clostridia bacterium]|nr:dihydroorotase [Clostridia bacterium]